MRSLSFILASIETIPIVEGEECRLMTISKRTQHLRRRLFRSIQFKKQTNGKIKGKIGSLLILLRFLESPDLISRNS